MMLVELRRHEALAKIAAGFVKLLRDVVQRVWESTRKTRFRKPSSGNRAPRNGDDEYKTFSMTGLTEVRTYLI
jgi:hypothetical protein